MGASRNSNKNNAASRRNTRNSQQSGSNTSAAPETSAAAPTSPPPTSTGPQAGSTHGTAAPEQDLASIDPRLRGAGGSPTATPATPPVVPTSAAVPDVVGQGVSAPPPIDLAQFAFDPAVNPNLDVAALVARVQTLQAQFEAFTAPPTTPGADRFTNATGRRLVVPTLSDAPDSVPKPKGSAGGGQRGYHLQAAMGLTGPDSDQLYNMILSTVRELVHAARIDLSREYRHVSAEVLSRIFASARRIHPYLARFERDWATAAIVKQYMSSARRYGRRKNYFPPPPDDNAPGPSRRRNLDDM